MKNILQQSAICLALLWCLTAMCSPSPPIVGTKPTTKIVEQDAAPAFNVPSVESQSNTTFDKIGTKSETPPKAEPLDPQPATAKGQPTQSVYQQYTPRRRLFGRWRGR